MKRARTLGLTASILCLLVCISLGAANAASKIIPRTLATYNATMEINEDEIVCTLVALHLPKSFFVNLPFTSPGSLDYGSSIWFSDGISRYEISANHIKRYPDAPMTKISFEDLDFQLVNLETSSAIAIKASAQDNIITWIVPIETAASFGIDVNHIELEGGNGGGVPTTDPLMGETSSRQWGFFHVPALENMGYTLNVNIGQTLDDLFSPISDEESSRKNVPTNRAAEPLLKLPEEEGDRLPNSYFWQLNNFTELVYLKKDDGSFQRHLDPIALNYIANDSATDITGGCRVLVNPDMGDWHAITHIASPRGYLVQLNGYEYFLSETSIADVATPKKNYTQLQWTTKRGEYSPMVGGETLIYWAEPTPESLRAFSPKIDNLDIAAEFSLKIEIDAGGWLPGQWAEIQLEEGAFLRVAYMQDLSDAMNETGMVSEPFDPSAKIETPAFTILALTPFQSTQTEGDYAYILQSDGARITHYVGDNPKYFVSPKKRKKLTVPASLGGVPVVAIGDGAFKDWNDIGKVTLPKTLVTIGNEAFHHSGITEIVIPDSVISLGTDCFSHCGALQKVTLSKNLQEIPFGCFRFSGITEIKIPASVKKLRYRAFFNCTMLKKVTLAEGLEEIDSDVFIDTDKLKSVKIPASVISISRLAFGNQWNEQTTIPHVKAGSPAERYLTVLKPDYEYKVVK